MVNGRSKNFLLRKVSLIFVSNAQIFESSQLLSFNSLNLEALIFDSLTNLAALFQVVKSLLLLTVAVVLDLSSYCVSVFPEGLVTLIIQLSFIFLLLFLFIDYSEEFVSLSLGLLGKHDLLLEELLPASNVKIR